MYIRNSQGRIVNVPDEIGLRKIARGECTMVEGGYEVGSLAKKIEAIPEMEYEKDLPLISVIIPSRVGETIRTLASLEKQTYKNLEIIILYDYNREGAPVMRNQGFQMSNGRLVLFSDNDIDWEPNAIKLLYDTLKDSDASYSYGSYMLGNSLVAAQEFALDALQKANYISTMCLVRKEHFPGFDVKLKRFEDWDLWLTMASKGHFGKFCGQTIFSTPIRDGISRGKNAMNFEQAKKAIYRKHGIEGYSEKLADIIIPHHNRHDLLAKCLEKIPNDLFNIVIQSGGSFAENCNRGALNAETDTLIFLNDDTLPTVEALKELAQHPAQIVGAPQINPSKGNQMIYGVKYVLDNSILKESLSRTKEDTSIPVGFALKVDKDAWEKLKGFNEKFKNGGEDQDFAFRAIEQGFSIGYIDTIIIHEHNSSEGRFAHSSENRLLMDALWPKEKIVKLLNLK